MPRPSHGLPRYSTTSECGPLPLGQEIFNLQQNIINIFLFSLPRRAGRTSRQVNGESTFPDLRSTTTRGLGVRDFFHCWRKRSFSYLPDAVKRFRVSVQGRKELLGAQPLILVVAWFSAFAGVFLGCIVCSPGLCEGVPVPSEPPSPRGCEAPLVGSPRAFLPLLDCGPCTGFSAVPRLSLPPLVGLWALFRGFHVFIYYLNLVVAGKGPELNNCN